MIKDGLRNTLSLYHLITLFTEDSQLPSGFPNTRAALARCIDHTLLKPEATAADIEKLCVEAREYGFFGGNVQYVDGVDSDYAANGVYHPDTNPTGEVLTPGYLYEVKNIPDFNKTSDTRVELVGVIKI